MVPGTPDPTGTRAAEAPAQAQGLLQESWERARLSCEQPGVCLDQGGLNRKNFSKRKRKQRHSGARELSVAATAPGAPPPLPLDCEHGDKQPQCSPEALLRAPRLADWGPTTETPEGCPHLKPQVGEHLEQRLAAPPTGPKQRTPVRRDSVPGQPHQPERLKPRPAGSACCERPKHKVAGSADQRPDCLPHLQRLTNTCAQSPAGPTSSLGQRQNTQQRGAPGLGETAG